MLNFYKLINALTNNFQNYKIMNHSKNEAFTFKKIVTIRDYIRAK